MTSAVALNTLEFERLPAQQSGVLGELVDMHTYGPIRGLPDIGGVNDRSASHLDFLAGKITEDELAMVHVRHGAVGRLVRQSRDERLRRPVSGRLRQVSQSLHKEDRH